MNPGDLVRLKSGGPLMTVAEVTNKDVLCFWFQAADRLNAERLRKRTFPLITLVAAGSETKLFDAPTTVEAPEPTP